MDVQKKFIGYRLQLLKTIWNRTASNFFRMMDDDLHQDTYQWVLWILRAAQPRIRTNLLGQWCPDLDLFVFCVCHNLIQPSLSASLAWKPPKHNGLHNVLCPQTLLSWHKFPIVSTETEGICVKNALDFRFGKSGNLLRSLCDLSFHISRKPLRRWWQVSDAPEAYLPFNTLKAQRCRVGSLGLWHFYIPHLCE